MLCTLSAAISLLSTTPRVFDSVFAPAAIRTLVAAGCDRSHSFTTVLDREVSRSGRTVLERALTAVLDELGDESRYVEYWWRGGHRRMDSHRDVDEALCRSRSHAGTAVGVQRCPQSGHVLYLELAEELRGPTCVWEEVPLSRITLSHTV